MILFIQVENGQTINHPITKENLLCFFPDLTDSKPPEGFARFVRLPVPPAPPKMLLDYVEYVYDEDFSKENGCPTYTDKYVFRPYTDEERAKIIYEYKSLIPEQRDWIFDDELNSLVPPIPKPDDGREYMWVFPDPAKGIEGKWEAIEKTLTDNEGLLSLLQAMKEVQQEMDVSDSAYDAAKQTIIS